MKMLLLLLLWLAQQYQESLFSNSKLLHGSSLIKGYIAYFFDSIQKKVVHISSTCSGHGMPDTQFFPSFDDQ